MRRNLRGSQIRIKNQNGKEESSKSFQRGYLFLLFFLGPMSVIPVLTRRSASARRRVNENPDTCVTRKIWIPAFAGMTGIFIVRECPGYSILASGPEGPLARRDSRSSIPACLAGRNQYPVSAHQDLSIAYPEQEFGAREYLSCKNFQEPMSIMVQIGIDKLTTIIIKSE